MERSGASDPLGLAPWAQTSAGSRGRRVPEQAHDYRTDYQRDRDRVIHCRAFRRLEYKTQVFVNHEGDHYRTRLTHTIEVSQIGRTVARALSLNEDLVETLALSHDLGHAPFGHLGEDILAELLAEFGGFNHNRQSLRIVELLEDRHTGHAGLNLTWEVREGIAKHSGPIDLASAPEFIEYEPEQQPPLEAQMIDLVDEIAYNHHDIDDGLESGLIDIDELTAEVPLFAEPFEAAREAGARGVRELQTKALRGMIDRLVSDLIETTRENVAEMGPAGVDDIRRAGKMLVGLSPTTARENRRLKTFLRRRLYQHHRIERMKDKFGRMLRMLFERYCANPRLLPEAGRGQDEPVERRIADYIAGMTDRFAIQEYQRLFDPSVRS